MQQMEEERVQTKKAMEELRELRDNVEDSALRTETEQSERLKQLEAELEKQRDQSRDAIQGEQSARTLASSLRDELKSAQLLATRAEALEKEKKKLEQDCDRVSFRLSPSYQTQAQPTDMLLVLLHGVKVIY